MAREQLSVTLQPDMAARVSARCGTARKSMIKDTLHNSNGILYVGRGTVQDSGVWSLESGVWRLTDSDLD